MKMRLFLRAWFLSALLLISSIIGFIQLFSSLAVAGESATAQCKPMPAIFENNRIFLKISTSDKSYKFYTDSGGGIYPFVYEDVAVELGMKLNGKLGADVFTASFPKEFNQQIFQFPSLWNKNVKVIPTALKCEANAIRFMIGDGFLGASLFMNHIWKFNYPEQQLSVCNRLPEVTNFKKIKMYFKRKKGEMVSGQPRIQILVNNQAYSVLFDTGATSFYSEDAKKSLGNKSNLAPSSFIADSVFDSWHKKFPTWRVIQNGEKFSGGGNLIEVPEVEIAGLKIGPVWFASRKDTIYKEYSSSNMDATIEGAVGGSLLRYLEIIADYKNENLYLREQK